MNGAWPRDFPSGSRPSSRNLLPNRIPHFWPRQQRMARPISSIEAGQRALLKSWTMGCSALPITGGIGNTLLLRIFPKMTGHFCSGSILGGRAFLFLLDPGRRQRIKLWGRARVIEDDPALIERLFDKGYQARPERAILFTIEAWDVNCSAHIVTRFTETEIEEGFAAVQSKIAGLEAENSRLRAALAKQ